MLKMHLTLIVLLCATTADGQPITGNIAQAPAITKEQMDQQLATQAEAWRDSNGNLPPPLLLQLGMNPTDSAAARAYVLWVEAKTDRTALAQLNVTVETHRRALERLEAKHPFAIRAALGKLGYRPDQIKTPDAQLAIQKEVETVRQLLRQAELEYQERARVYQTETTRQ